MSKKAMVTARLHESTKHKLILTGYNASDAIEWFVHHWYADNPEQQLEIQQDLEEIELDRLRQEEEDVKLKIKTKENIINKLAAEKRKCTLEADN